MPRKTEIVPEAFGKQANSNRATKKEQCPLHRRRKQSTSDFATGFGRGDDATVEHAAHIRAEFGICRWSHVFGDCKQTRDNQAVAVVLLAFLVRQRRNERLVHNKSGIDDRIQNPELQLRIVRIETGSGGENALGRLQYSVDLPVLLIY